MSEQMRECPFVHLHHGELVPPRVCHSGGVSWVQCCCGVSGPWADDDAAAIAAWNKRAGDADYRRLRELERAVRDAMRKLPLGSGWVWKGDSVDIAAIGRLLEGKE